MRNRVIFKALLLRRLFLPRFEMVLVRDIAIKTFFYLHFHPDEYLRASSDFGGVILLREKNNIDLRTFRSVYYCYVCMHCGLEHQKGNTFCIIGTKQFFLHHKLL